MKNNIKGVIVVEGSSDASFLSSIVNAHIFVTNGLDLSKEKMNFLKEVSKVNDLIILTDLDLAGNRIRDKIRNKIDNAYAVFIQAKSRKNYKKNGIAELEIRHVLEALESYMTDEPLFDEDYDLVSLISLSNNPKEKKQEIVKRFNLVNGNNKYLESQLKMLKISKEELWK